jgi:hypothetical protein
MHVELDGIMHAATEFEGIPCCGGIHLLLLRSPNAKKPVSVVTQAVDGEEKYELRNVVGAAHRKEQYQ